MLNAPVKKKAKKSKKQRKVGRNAAFCQYYRNTNRREKNKIKRLKKHLISFPTDRCAKDAIDRCKAVVSGYSI